MTLPDKIAALPHAPGVYIMKGRTGGILYVGKAKQLAVRVRSYFHAGADLSPKTRAWVGQIADIEYFVVGSDLEALILEGNLIKKHRPRYNVVLRDDKNYPFLRLPIQEDYPRLEIVRRVKKDGAIYFGPYIPSGGLHEMLRLLHRLFPLPNCTIQIDGTAERPCIEYEIGRCLAPCTGFQSQAAYRAMIAQVQLFLAGRSRTLLVGLKDTMRARADALQFEEAARVRDQIARIERAMERQRITSTRMDDLDVIGMARDGDAADAQILFIRGGMLVGRKDFFLDAGGEMEDAALCAVFLQQFYNKETLIPAGILVPVAPPDPGTMARWLSEQRGGRVRLIVPARGRGARLVALAHQNAKMALSDRLGQRAGSQTALSILQTRLGLARLPNRIAGYDISNIMGAHAVGAMVVFEGGMAKKSDWRRFRIRTIEGANDFGMMAEVLTRAYGRRHASSLPASSADSPDPVLPDLILIDGGRGQVSAACEALAALGLGAIDLMGLAKERGERGERIYLPGASEPMMLPVGDPATHLLMQIRDAAHRFAVTYHRKVRDKGMLTSVLDEVEGIGKTRRLALLKHFGGLAGIRTATVAALAAAPAMNQKAAQSLHRALHGPSTGELSTDATAAVL